jgi:hypothetical protein
MTQAPGAVKSKLTHYSWRAMPWKAAKAAPPPDNTLFEACFRIQREACKAAGRHVPLVVENVRGAQKWVGRARWNFGSYYLWGDVPALMPITRAGMKNAGGSWFRVSHNNVPHSRGDAIRHTPHMANPAEHEGVKVPGGGKDGWFGADHPSPMRKHHSQSTARKMASAMIAKIPFTLARHIAAVYRPRTAA